VHAGSFAWEKREATRIAKRPLRYPRPAFTKSAMTARSPWAHRARHPSIAAPVRRRHVTPSAGYGARSAAPRRDKSL